MFRALQENLNQESFEKINRRERQWRSKNYKLGGGGKKILVIKKSSEKIWILKKFRKHFRTFFKLEKNVDHIL